MCGGVFFIHKGEEHRYYFPNPKAVLPVKMKKGNEQLFPWGRRTKQMGRLPKGGWARLDSIYAGRWDRFMPVAVKLPISSFMEKDIEGIQVTGSMLLKENGFKDSSQEKGSVVKVDFAFTN